MAWLSKQCIFPPLNQTNSTIYAILVAHNIIQLPDTSVELNSVLDESQAVHFPMEFLNSLEVSGFPSRILF